MPATLAEGGEAVIVFRECAAVGAGDALVLHERGEVAPGGGLGDSEAGAEVFDGEVALLLNQLCKLVSPGEHDVHRNFHEQRGKGDLWRMAIIKASVYEGIPEFYEARLSSLSEWRLHGASRLLFG